MDEKKAAGAARAADQPEAASAMMEASQPQPGAAALEARPQPGAAALEAQPQLGTAPRSADEPDAAPQPRPAVSRRAFALGAVGFAGLFAVGGAGVAFNGERALLRPPGAQDEDAFLANCLKCDKCRSICPQDCISVGVLEDGIVNFRTPKMDFRKGYCTFCDKCTQVCPTKAVLPFDENVEKIGVAVIDASQCIAYEKNGCQKCVDACAYDAVHLDDAGRPVVDAGVCNGCGQCEYVCPSSSFRSYSGSKNRGINVERSAQGGTR